MKSIQSVVEEKEMKRRRLVIHKWLTRNYGTADHCDSKTCKATTKYFGYALKKGMKDEKNRDNYLQLCITCHRLYDSKRRRAMNNDLLKCYACKEMKSRHLFSPDRFLLSGRRSTCRDCHRVVGLERFRKNKATIIKNAEIRRQKNKNNPVYKLKNRTRARTKHALKKGILIKQLCEICGDKKVQAHHPDYNDHLNIKWLCTKHHAEQHLKEKADRDFIEKSRAIQSNNL